MPRSFLVRKYPSITQRAYSNSQIENHENEPANVTKHKNVNYDETSCKQMKINGFEIKSDASHNNANISKEKLDHPKNQNVTLCQNAAGVLSPLAPFPNIAFIHNRLGMSPSKPVRVINGGFGIENPLAVPEKQSRQKIQEAEKQDLSCTKCSKVFKSRRHLRRHVKCHSDIKRYVCSFCMKGFHDKYDLKRHTRIHTGVRPYKCNYCEASFTQRICLESHQLKVHQVNIKCGYKQRREKIYVCEECGHSTYDGRSHYSHVSTTHPRSSLLPNVHDKRSFPAVTNSQQMANSATNLTKHKSKLQAQYKTESKFKNVDMKNYVINNICDLSTPSHVNNTTNANKLNRTNSAEPTILDMSRPVRPRSAPILLSEKFS